MPRGAAAEAETETGRRENETEEGGVEEPKLRVIPFDPKYLETEKDKELFEKGKKQGNTSATFWSRDSATTPPRSRIRRRSTTEMESRHVAVQAAVTDGGPTCRTRAAGLRRREGFKSSIKRLHLPTPANMQ